MEEETNRCRAPTVCDGKDPSKEHLSHLKRLRVGDQEENERAVKGVLGLQCEVQTGHSIPGLEFLQCLRALAGRAIPC